MHDRTTSLPAATSPASRAIVLSLFFASGLSALIYQVIWLRSLATIFGSTVYATTTVLAAFMGGLALGSYLFGRKADGSSRPLFLYGVLEIGIGLFALAFPLLMKLYENMFVALYPKISLSFYVLSLVRFVVCAAVLIVPTTMMGGTFPLINRFYIRKFESVTANVSLLYGINTIGAVFGVVLAGFFFIERIGIFRTSLIAIAVNIAVGVLAIVVQKRLSSAPDAKSTSVSQNKPRTQSKKLGLRSRRLIMLAAFLSGLASLAYEVIWTRTLIFILDSFVYSFSIMLATFLVGISVGSFALNRMAPRIKQGYVLLGVLFVLIGFSSLATMPFFAELGLWKDAYLQSISENAGPDTPAPWGKYILFKFFVSFLIMIVPTLLMGAAFPLAIKLYASTLEDIGEKIGNLYAANTIGAILGSFFAGFIFIRFVGLRNSLIVIAGISVATGIMLFLLQERRALTRRAAYAAVPAVLFALLVLVLPQNVYERIFQKAQKTFDLVYYKEDPTATVTVHERGDRVIININGLNVAGTGFNFLTTQKIQAHLGLLLHPNPQRALQVGFGSGGTCYSVSLHETIRDIDCVELCKGVIDAARYFMPSNHQVLQNPVVNLTIEDARNFVLATPHRYDLILSDSIHPTYAGNGTLYSRDYFLLCKEKLNPGGFVSFWMPMYLLAPLDYQTIIKTFQSVFPYVTIWYVNSAVEAYSIVIGRSEPITIDAEQIERKIADPAIARDLAAIEAHNVTDILSYFMMGPDRVREYAKNGDINSDDYPIIELRAPKSMTRRRTWFQNLQDLAERREPVMPFVTNAGRTEEEVVAFTSKLETAYAAVGQLIQGQLLNIISYNFQDEYRYYEKAAEIWPGNPAIERMQRLTASRLFVRTGEQSLKANRLDEALGHYNSAIEVNPDPFDDTVGYAYYRRGFIFSRQGDPARAQAELEKSLSILPTQKQALLLSGLIAVNAGDRATATRRLAQLTRLYPRDDEVKKLRKRM